MVWALPPQKIPAAVIFIRVTGTALLERPYRTFIYPPTAHPMRIPRLPSRIILDHFSVRVRS